MKTKKEYASNNVNLLFILTIAFIALCLFVPVWQSAISSQLQKSLFKANADVEIMEEQKMTLQASVAQRNTPEYVMTQASEKNIAFARIAAGTSTAVASSN